jgi:hypothetical protein
LDATKLTPALLHYNETASPPLSQNQAVRYLLYAIDTLGDATVAVHNALISIYASHSTTDEGLLLQYLRSHEPACYDVDFALRLCLQFRRVQSGVYIYTTMELYEQAIDLALSHGEIELAMQVADAPEEDPPRRKKLWLTIATTVIADENGMKR